MRFLLMQHIEAVPQLIDKIDLSEKWAVKNKVIGKYNQ